jgi:uncharacterized protein (TIGR02996 family)
MGDGEALLRAILGQPKEDTPRLVYADWCDENGRPERAEFIRVQVELARLDSGPLCPVCHWPYRAPTGCEPGNCSYRPSEGHPEYAGWKKRQSAYHALRRRERELLSYKFLEDMGGEFCGGGRAKLIFWWKDTGGRGVEFTFSRGFVSHVSCSWPDWRTHADAILAAQPVERVRLTTPPDWAGIWHRRPDGTEYTEWGQWPRIEFELPPERGEVGGRRATMTFFDEYQSLREWWDNHTQTQPQ